MSKMHESAFTLAEVLITLGIVGVITAMTLPPLIDNNNARGRKTALAKAYSVLSQAHQMMLVRNIFPYETFVEPFLIEEDEDSPSNPSDSDTDNPDNSGNSGSSEKPSEPDNPGSSGGSDKPVEPENPGDSGSSDPSIPDMNDTTTKDLVDGIFDALQDSLKHPIDFPGHIDNVNKIINNIKELHGIYGDNNLGQFIKDYASQSNIELPGWFEDLLGSNEFLDNNYLFYKHLFASLAGGSSGDDLAANFIKVKQYQLEVLKGLLNGASYCESYDKCAGSKPYSITTLSGTPAEIEAAEFDNSALKTADGMYIWLGDINNPQRYYVDINGEKRPNKLGVDVFTFDIIKKQAIKPEQSGNCTVTGTPSDGEGYRGLGCAGYAVIDRHPDLANTPYWKNIK